MPYFFNTDEDRRQMLESHSNHTQYIDLRSNAKDSLYPEDVDTLNENISDVFDVVRGNILRAAGKEVQS